MALDVRQVASKRDFNTFIKLPWRLYRNEPNWVPPLLFDRKRFLDRSRNPFFEHAEVEFFLGVVPTSPYVLPGTPEFAESVVPYLGRTNTLVLASHGTVAFGPDLETARQNTEYLDAYCRVLLLARPLGGPQRLSDESVQELLALKRRHGLDDVRLDNGEPS